MNDQPAKHAESYRATISWLHTLPADTVVPWNDDGGGARPWFLQWVDVIVLDLMAAARLGWVWTIRAPDSDSTAGKHGGRSVSSPTRTCGSSRHGTVTPT